MADEGPFLKSLQSLLQLPFFQELDTENVELSPAEEKELQEEVRRALMRYLLNLPAFQELEEGEKGEEEN